MPRPKTTASRARLDEWELHRRELSRLFVVEGLPVAAIAKHMKNERGFDKRPKDYEYRLKKWNLRRNLHGPELMSIQSQLSRRKEAGLSSEIVVSGIRWSESMVRGRLERHKSPWHSIDVSAFHKLPDFLARVQTPSPLMMGLPEWPNNLPWLQFNRSIHEALASLTKSTTASRTCRLHGEESLLIQMMRPYVTKLCPKRTEPLEVAEIHAPRRMRAMLEVTVPQAHAGDHETTAEILHNGSYESRAVELVRLLIYLESNNMIDQFEQLLGYHVNLAISSNMMDFLRGIGFLTKSNINWLRGRAAVTGQIFLKRVLAHSILDENSIDVLGWLIPDIFDVNQRWETAGVQPLGKHQSLYRNGLTLLQASCLAENLNAVRLLLNLGVDPFGTIASPEEAPVKLAADLACQDRATAIANLLLSTKSRISAEIRKEALRCALQQAIARSHRELIKMLLSESERLGDGAVCSEDFTIAAKRADCATMCLLIDNASRHAGGPVHLPEDILFSVMSVTGQRIHTITRADQIVEVLSYLLDLGVNPSAPRCKHDCIGSFCIEFLIFLEIPGVENWRNDTKLGEDRVLKMIEAMRKHGCPQERPLASTASTGKDRPSSLQAAISLGYTRLVEYLLDWGADIDFVKDESRSTTPTYKDCQFEKAFSFLHIRGCSPLLTALEYGQGSIAKMLLRRKPNLKLHGGEILLAIQRCDDPELVAILSLDPGGTATDDQWKSLLEEAVLMRRPNLIKFLLPMNADGRTKISPATIMRAALVIGDYDKAYRLTTVCDYDSRTLFEAVLQSQKVKRYYAIVERLLQMRPNARNDGFEIRAVACAAVNHDTHLLRCLMKVLGQGPWIAAFPRDGIPPSEWVPGWRGVAHYRTHILPFAAKLTKPFDGDKILEELLKANVSAKDWCLDDTEDLPSLSEETLNCLFAAGLDPNQPRLLFHAVANDMLAHAQAVCDAKVDLKAMLNLDTRNLYGSRTAIQVAVEWGSPEMLQLLLHYGADVNDPAGYYCGATCLQLAAGQGNIGIVRFLLNKGAKVNAKRSLCFGRTAIEIAAENGKLDVLQLLLMQEEHHFRTEAERYQFIRAAKMAEQRGHPCLIKMLQQHINWTSGDQKLFDEMTGCRSFEVCLDDMTQKVSESEKRDKFFWADIQDSWSEAELPDIYDTEGIEQWIGELPDEQVNDYFDSDSEIDFSCEEEEEGSAHSSESLATARPQPAQYDESEWDCDHHATCWPMHDNINDLMEDVLLEGPHGDRASQEPGTPLRALSCNQEWRQVEATLAPLATRHDHTVPTWLHMEENVHTSADKAMLEDSEQRPAPSNLDHSCGRAFGEVQQLQNGDLGDEVVCPVNTEPVDGDWQDFIDWGLLDEQ
ncbi:hypothetical protein KVR01_006236 [Diaporthe batatas]|uniref:uncharacterized protein n=1 Tax=Diaporthe batatas TaxID=748121 RepID=UPI001D036358|nr:uncharacterized protein KVR01_006236 [Diaporthe batatas]KAG8164318.1 hypothetical protein KVR01_006236 [Diaporthe batatas]